MERPNMMDLWRPFISGKPRPLILIVHGAWHQPVHYASFISELQRRDFTAVHCPRLPTSSSLEATFEDDIKCIRGVTLENIKAGHKVVAIMHGYGGTVGTRAFSGLGSGDGTNPMVPVTDTPGVSKLIYISAFMQPQRGRLDQPFRESPVPFSASIGDEGTVQIANPEALFYNDLNPDQQQAAINLMVPHALHVQEASFRPLRSVRAAWWDIQSIQISCSQDQFISKDYQMRMVRRISRQLKASGLGVAGNGCSSGHCPFLSMPEELARIVEHSCAEPQLWTDHSRWIPYIDPITEQARYGRYGPLFQSTGGIPDLAPSQAGQT